MAGPGGDWSPSLRLVWAQASLDGLAGLASTSLNSNTSTSVLGMEERFAEEEEQLSSSSGIFFILFEGEDFGQGGRGPKGAASSSTSSKSAGRLMWFPNSDAGSNKFSRLSELSLIWERVSLGGSETGTSHLYLTTCFLSSSWNAALVGRGLYGASSIFWLSLLVSSSSHSFSWGRPFGY